MRGDVAGSGEAGAAGGAVSGARAVVRQIALLGRLIDDAVAARGCGRARAVGEASAGAGGIVAAVALFRRLVHAVVAASRRRRAGAVGAAAARAGAVVRRIGRFTVTWIVPNSSSIGTVLICVRPPWVL